MRRTGRVKVQNEQGPATGQAKQGTGPAENTQDKRYRTSRVQLQDRQNKVQDQQAMQRTEKVKVQDEHGPATGQAKQGT
jgi:hypothetical protein